MLLDGRRQRGERGLDTSVITDVRGGRKQLLCCGGDLLVEVVSEWGEGRCYLFTGSRTAAAAAPVAWSSHAEPPMCPR
ncbi:predicted protein [Streptomyces viridochromogenes DSM 40736]|uniref:Predicted protein n=1 Tax=Streptomyces viridochromogenes (strain DSM 40736 / JCM 4977 / BCRC 1201 / Tue 494) TaxID=591159 RepID=D9XHP6_STRVT|nr:predicted protein [Streptomyces viridochromogenes DSM 40736]